MEAIILNNAERDFKNEITAKIGLEKIKPCYSCSSCTGVCPVREVVEDFDPRRMIHMITLGMKKEILSSELIWFCCCCNSCYSVCPQGIRFSRVVRELQKMALEQNYVSGHFLKELKRLEFYRQDLCRRTLFQKVKEGFWGTHKMPCWRTMTKDTG